MHVPSIISLLTLVFATVGCVNVETKPMPEGWPKIVPATSIEDFSGRYIAEASRRSISKKYPADNPLDDLSYFLSGSATDQSEVSLDATSKGLLLSDGNGNRITMLPNRRFRSRDGILAARRFTSAETDGLWGAGAAYLRNDLYLASDGSLIGQQRGTGPGLGFWVMPVLGSGNHWILWERVDH